MRFAYADPPYPGQAKRWYADHPDYAGEVDHPELIARLVRDYPDGWALSTSAAALQEVLALCPPVRIAIWHVTNAEPPGGKTDRWHRTWEPVLVAGGRQRKGEAPVVRNLLAAGSLMGSAAVNAGVPRLIPGQKPPRFIEWLFALLGAGPGDELDDLYPGSGVVAQGWSRYQSQPQLIEYQSQPQLIEYATE